MPFYAITFNDGAGPRYWSGRDYRRGEFSPHCTQTYIREEADEAASRLRRFNALAGKGTFEVVPAFYGKGRNCDDYLTGRAKANRKAGVSCP